MSERAKGTEQEPAPAPPTQTMAAIRTQGLCKAFGRQTVVDRVDLHAPVGCTYGLIGLNGAGKSTIIRMLVGLLPPTRGTCLVGGLDVHREPVKVRAGLGYVPDRPNAYSWMRVREVVAFCRAMHARWNDTLVSDLLGRARIDAGQRVGKLSKGTAAKLSLALALGHDPGILVLDEPTDGLDPIARDEFMEQVLASVCDRPRTVLISSHSLSDVQRMADVVGLMHNGRLMVQCPTDELLATTKRVRALLGDGARTTPPRAPEGAVWSRMEGREWIVTIRNFTRDAVERVRAAEVDGGVRSIEVMDMSLDDVFKDFVRGQEAAA